MCLYTKQKEPLVATHDIVCLKYLGKNALGFHTPYKIVKVELDKELKAEGNEAIVKSICEDIFGEEMFTIEGGFVHARLEPDDSIANYCMKAIISKGTKYFLSVFGDEIAAKTMIITSEETDKIVDKDLLKDIINNAPNENGVYVGDYLLQDGIYIRPTEINSLHKLALVGQVVGFHKHKPLIAAIDILEEVWNIRYKEVRNGLGRKEAITLFNGKKVTQQAMRRRDKDSFVAIALCDKYREDSKEQWYLPALGEMSVLLNNTMYVNAARKFTKIGKLITEKMYFWTCSEFNSNYSWYCNLYLSKVRRYWHSKNNKNYIIPFLASLNRQENSLVKSIWKRLRCIIWR